MPQINAVNKQVCTGSDTEYMLSSLVYNTYNLRHHYTGDTHGTLARV